WARCTTCVPVSPLAPQVPTVAGEVGARRRDGPKTLRHVAPLTERRDGPQSAIARLATIVPAFRPVLLTVAESQCSTHHALLNRCNERVSLHDERSRRARA